MMKPTPIFAAVCFASLLACTEYGLGSAKDMIGGDSAGMDDTAMGIPDVDACDGADEPDADSVALNTECAVDLSTGTFSPVIEWDWGTGAFCGPAAVAQTIDTNGSGAIDGQDTPIIFVYQGGTANAGGGRVVALYGDNSGPIAWSSGMGYGQDGGFAVGDLDLDGWPEVVTADTNKVCALSGQDGTQKWCAQGLGTSMDPYGYNYPSIADMDGDGLPEVTVGNAILAGTNGALLGKGSYGKGAAPYQGTGASGSYGTLSVPVDLDGDGQLELVTGNAAYDKTGNTVWTNGGLDGLVAVADFDGDGQGEIVKTSGIYLTGMESNGTEVWGPINFGGGSNTNLGAPAIDDLDGDGVPEFVFAAQNQLIAMEWGGTELWRATVSDQTGAAGPVLFDFEMDGYPEVLYADEVSIRFFSGLDGTEKFTSQAHSSYTILETPIVADVDGDDQVEIVLGHCGNGFSSEHGAVTVYGDADQSWPPGRKIWNQHAYTITNVGELGDIPNVGNNWPAYNSFRSGDVGRPPSEYIDLRAQILDVCEDECEQGNLYVAARVLNAGNVEAPAGIPVSLRAGPGGNIVGIEVTTDTIPAGTTSDMVRFSVGAAQLAGRKPVVVADENLLEVGIVYECQEDNNGEAWSSAVCN
jgi:hypothetical protein